MPAAAVPTDRGSRLNFRRPNFPAFLAPPRNRSFRFSQGVFGISEPQGGDALRDVNSSLMQPFRSEFSGVFRRTHKPMKFEDRKASLRLF